MTRLLDLSVGCANCAIISTDEAVLMVDCGGIEARADALPTRRAIDCLVVTHQHGDHFDGLDFLLRGGYSIGKLIYSPYRPRLEDRSVDPEEWARFEELAARFAAGGTELAAPYGRPSRNDPLWRAAGMALFALGPDPRLARAEGRCLHDACLVLSVEIGAKRVIFTGDASRANLEAVASSGAVLSCDLLHASHHGGEEGASAAFLRLASPESIVVSTEEGVYEGLPDPETLAIYASAVRGRTYRTDVDGDLEFFF